MNTANEELMNALKAHDWTYEMSDDPRVLREGDRSMAAILGAIRDIGDMAAAMSYSIKVPEQTRAAYESRVMRINVNG